MFNKYDFPKSSRLVTKLLIMSYQTNANKNPIDNLYDTNKSINCSDNILSEAFALLEISTKKITNNKRTCFYNTLTDKDYSNHDIYALAAQLSETKK